MINKAEFPYIPYNLKNGVIRRGIDNVLNNLPIAENDAGMNCQLYASVIERARGYDIPDYYRSSEWFDDPDRVLESINYPDTLIQTGDVLGFSTPDETDMKRLHIGVARVAPDGGIHILHASRLAGKVIITPLNEMSFDSRYTKLYMARRPKVKTLPVNIEALTALGWFAIEDRI